MILAIYFLGFFAAGVIVGAVGAYLIVRAATSNAIQLTPRMRALQECMSAALDAGYEFGSAEFYGSVRACMQRKHL
jgi:hypothetical protein